MGLFSFLGISKEKSAKGSNIPTNDVDLKYSSRSTSKCQLWECCRL